MSSLVRGCLVSNLAAAFALASTGCGTSSTNSGSPTDGGGGGVEAGGTASDASVDGSVSPSGDASVPLPDSGTSSLCSSVSAGPSADFGGYRLFPATHPLNTRIDGANIGVSAHSSDWITGCDASHLQADFSMPYNVAAASAPPATLQSVQYGGVINPWPFSSSDLFEGDHSYDGGAYDGDHHCLVFSLADCKSYESYQLDWTNTADTTFNAAGASVWDTTGTASPSGDQQSVADAAGLPMLATLIRYDELVTRGSIQHALRFTCQHSSDNFIPPARAAAGSGHAALNWPPMGARARLKAGFDVTGGGTFTPKAITLLTAIQQYGIILADNGSGFFVTGDTKVTYPDVWTDADIKAFQSVSSSMLEFIDEDAQIQSF